MHIPVLLNEVLHYLDPKPNDNFIDCTVGEGGHALAILKMTAPHGRVLGIDRDADMVGRLQEKAERLGVADRLSIHHGTFADVMDITQNETFPQPRGILFDFGMSSWQLDESGAGFSFQRIEPLDMRFDRTRGNATTAAEIVNQWPEESISRILFELGEERYARRIAKEVVMFRKKKRIETTDQLVNIVSRAVPQRRERKGINVATRTFQALRIAVNEELNTIKTGVEDAVGLLPHAGRVAAISFHSLEDRIIKNIFRKYSNNTKEGSSYDCGNGAIRDKGSPGLIRAEERKILSLLTKKPIVPGAEEVRENPRARSAKLRVAEKIA